MQPAQQEIVHNLSVNTTESNASTFEQMHDIAGFMQRIIAAGHAFATPAETQGHK